MPKPSFSDWYVILWSERLHSFHVETVSDLLKRNMGIYLGRQSHQNDYLPLAFAPTRDECDPAIERYKRALDSGEYAAEDSAS